MRDMLPISHAAAAILRQIFQSREEDSIDLPTLKKMVEEVDTFFMTDEELEGAQRHARSTAEDYFRPLSNKPVVTPPLVRQLVEVDDEWSQGLPYGISHLGSGNSGQSSGTSVAMESSEGWENSASHSGVRLGLPRQRVMPLIRDPSRSEGQIAWQRGKTVPAHMRPYSFRPSFDESESDSESGTCSLGSDECEADSGASTKRLGKSFPWNAHPSFETVGSIEPRRVIFGGIETGRFVGQYQKPWARMTAQFRRVLGIV